MTATFTSLDPLTGQAPTGVIDGFLPPDNSSGIGEGFVQYTVQPKSGLATGTAINQQASVVFDTNAPLDTATVVNTIDTAAPTSSVAPLPATETAPSFTVSWSGSDGAGSGIASYNVYVSDDGGTVSALAVRHHADLGDVYRPGRPHLQLLQRGDQQRRHRPAGSDRRPGDDHREPRRAPTPPTIIGEQVLFTRKLNKKHKPIGKPVLTGFELDFSAAMDPATAGNAANYQLDWTSTKTVKKKHVTILHPVPFTVRYDAATDAVNLILSGKQAFAKGGEITVIAAPPNGVSSSAGTLLDGNDEGVAGDNGTFTILPKGRGITRG